MNLNLEDLNLSGKGFQSSSEYLNDNVKIITDGVNFHQVVMGESHFGWIVMGSMQILADFTAHTKDGMKGRSVDDLLEYALIVDRTELLGDFIGDLQEMESEDANKVLDKYKSTSQNNMHVDSDFDNKDGLIIISTKSDYVFVKSEKSTVRIHSGEILVLNSKNGKDNLVEISSKDGRISIGGDKSIEINDGRIIIDGKEFNPQIIIEKAMKGVATAFSGMFSSFI